MRIAPTLFFLILSFNSFSQQQTKSSVLDKLDESREVILKLHILEVDNFSTCSLSDESIGLIKNYLSSADYEFSMRSHFHFAYQLKSETQLSSFERTELINTIDKTKIVDFLAIHHESLALMNIEIDRLRELLGFSPELIISVFFGPTSWFNQVIEKDEEIGECFARIEL